MYALKWWFRDIGTTRKLKGPSPTHDQRLIYKDSA